MKIQMLPKELSSILGISLGSVNKLVGECLKDGLIQNHSEYGKYSLTEKGMEYLSSTVLMACYHGSRIRFTFCPALLRDTQRTS